MKNVQKIDLGLTGYDELFANDEERKVNKLPRIFDIPISEIDDFPDHPFKVKIDEDMDQLVQSIKERGIITPVTLRPKEDGRYEIVSGHRRKKACELAGLDTVKAEVREMSRDEAIILMVESNLQRSTILPSEKAFSYKMRLEAMNRQGQRTDLTSVPVAQKSTSREQLGKEVGESQDQVRRYIRLTQLIQPLLDLVDEGRIAFRPAVECWTINTHFFLYAVSVPYRISSTTFFIIPMYGKPPMAERRRLRTVKTPEALRLCLSCLTRTLSSRHRRSSRNYTILNCSQKKSSKKYLIKRRKKNMKNINRKNNTQKPEIPGKVKKGFRFYAAAVLSLALVMGMSVTAFAAGDPITVVNNLSDFIFGLIRAVGLILLGWGIVQVGLSFQSHDPSQRSNGFLTLAGGVIITFAKEILNQIVG